jgi:glucosamine-6-phosphate deaminase
MATASPLRRATFGRLAVEVHCDRPAPGRAAAEACAAYLREVIAQRGAARVGFAGAPTQDEFLAALIRPRPARAAIAWRKVVAFQLSDYCGLGANAPRSQRQYLAAHLLEHVPLGHFHPLEADLPDLAAAGARYAARLDEAPLDLVCLDLGENGHLAGNDPSVADFEDRASVKPVELDSTSRQQLVHDGCFPGLAAAPHYALTVTLPVLRRARRLTIQAPGARRAAAVRATLHDAITTACPATLLRLHPCARLYLDPDSAAQAFPASDFASMRHTRARQDQIS